MMGFHPILELDRTVDVVEAQGEDCRAVLTIDGPREEAAPHS